MRKRILSVLLCACMFALLLIGCGAKQGEETGGTNGKSLEGEEITVLIPPYGDPGQELLDEFEEETGIKVTMNAIAWSEIHDKIASAAMGETAVADVMEVGSVWLGEFTSADWLEPIELSEEEKADMKALSAFTVDDTVWAVPWCNDYRIAFYNKEHFAQAGITEAPKTWDEVYDAMVKIKEAGITEYPYTCPIGADEATTTTLFWMAWTKNNNVFNDDNSLDKEACLDALQFENKFMEAELIDPALINAAGADAYQKLLTGEASFMVGPTKFIRSISNEEECSVVGQIEAIMMPGETDIATHTNPFPEAVAINKFSEHKEAAEAYIKWFTSPEVQQKVYDVTGTIPTHTSAIEALIEDEKITNPGALVEQSEIIETPWPHGIPAYYSEYSSGIFNNMNKMYRGEQTAEEAYTAIEAHVNQVIKENQ